MNNSVNKSGAFLLALLLSGCQTGPTPFAWSSAESIKVGMTKDQVISKMGKPQEDVRRPDGTEGMVWSWNDGSRNNIVSFILRSNVVVSVPTHVASTKEDLRDYFLPRPKTTNAPPVVGHHEPDLYTNAFGQMRVNIPLVRGRDEYFDAHPELTKAQRDAIDDHRVWLGMPMEAALASWGRVANRQVTAVPGGRMEIWTYSSTGSLVFRNGVLVSFSE